MGILAFSHIPKTAGTSLNVLLRRYFGARLLAVEPRIRPDGFLYELRDLEQDQRLYRNFACISGHPLKPFVDFGRWEQEFSWFTFLREPSARYVSLYIHQQTNGMQEYQMDIRDWSSKFDRKNGMVQMIAGEQSVQKAIDILEEKIDFIGISEHYNESLTLLVRHFGLADFDLSMQGGKMISRNGELADEIKQNPQTYAQCIAENNVLDEQLYRYAIEKIWPQQKRNIAGIASQDSEGKMQGDLSKAFNRFAFKFKNEFLYRQLVRRNWL